MRSRPLTCGSRGMTQFQFGNHEDIEVGCRVSILEVKGHGLADVVEKCVRGVSLRENVFANSARAPNVSVLVNFHFYEHRICLSNSSYYTFTRPLSDSLSNRVSASDQYAFTFSHSFESASFM
jgi:hypothetical protein